MLKILNTYYRKQLFKPGIISILINPFYFTRLRLYLAIRQYAGNFKGRILDLGCGLKPYKHLFTGATEYVGVDIDNPGHDHSKEEVDVYYDGKNIPFDNKSFDCVFFSEVLEHVFNPDHIITDIHRVLKDNGNLMITTPFIWDEHEVPNDYCRYTSFGIRFLLEKNGFRINEYNKTGNFIEALSQLIILYLYHLLYSRNKYVNLIINTLFIAPFTMLGIFFSGILPRKRSMYLNNIVIAQKSRAHENSSGK